MKIITFYGNDAGFVPASYRDRAEKHIVNMVCCNINESIVSFDEDTEFVVNVYSCPDENYNGIDFILNILKEQGVINTGHNNSSILITDDYGYIKDGNTEGNFYLADEPVISFFRD